MRLKGSTSLGRAFGVLLQLYCTWFVLFPLFAISVRLKPLVDCPVSLLWHILVSHFVFWSLPLRTLDGVSDWSSFG